MRTEDENHQDMRSSGGIVRGANEMRHRKDIHGSTLRNASGETIVQDNGGGLVIKNNLGQIVKTIDRDENESRYTYNGNSELSRVELPNGEIYARVEKGAWIKIAEESLIERTDRIFDLLPEGTLRTTCHTNNGTKFYRDTMLDGSSSIINEHGRVTLLIADVNVQIGRLRAILEALHRDHRINHEQRQHACNSLTGLSRRVALEEITQQQAAQMLFHICRLLEHGMASPLGVQNAYKLAREVMFFAANPDETQIKDGLSALIQELYRRHPEQVANLVSDMGILKSYVTMSGVSVEYVEELMHPTNRKLGEWSIHDNFETDAESDRFIRVVMVNVLHNSRSGKIAQMSGSQRGLSTREYGRVRNPELDELFEQITGYKAVNLNFKASRPTEVFDCSNSFVSGKNKSSGIA